MKARTKMLLAAPGALALGIVILLAIAATIEILLHAR